jgi:hypothetical protein
MQGGCAITVGPNRMEEPLISASSGARQAKEECGSVGGFSEPASVLTYCPVCSHQLEQDHCKLVCRACGYYMSCSDYY